MNFKHKLSIIICAAGVFSSVSCKKLLEQNPKASITPAFFQTQSGVQGGISGVYQNLRTLYGQENFWYTMQTGTDESISGGSATGQGLAIETYNQFVNNVGIYNIFGTLFQNAYQDINTLNGVLLYGQTAITDPVVSKQYLAQAKFLRALLYFELVRSFGDVPLHTTFVTTASLGDTRAPIADVYNQIIQDLTQASTDLQTRPGEVITSSGTSPFAGHAVTKASALFLLSKVYLTRGWSTAAQPTDFQNALATAQNLINTRSTYGLALYPSYDAAYAEANDATNTEDIFAIEHNTDPKYGEYNLNASTATDANGWAWFYRPNYPTVVANYPINSGPSLMTRDLKNGRPYVRARPNTDWVESVLFADKTNDYRYWTTFQTTWIANNAVTTPRGTLQVGVDTAIWTPPYDPGPAKRAAFKGIIFIRPSLAAAASGTNANPWTLSIFPSVKKFDDPLRPGINDASLRPIVLFRLSELYLIAAEASLPADEPGALTYVNYITSRRTATAMSTSKQQLCFTGWNIPWAIACTSRQCSTTLNNGVLHIRISRISAIQ